MFFNRKKTHEDEPAGLSGKRDAEGAGAKVKRQPRVLARDLVAGLEPVTTVQEMRQWDALAVELGLDPYTLVYSMLYGLDQLLFPYEIGYMLYTFMSGAVTLKHVMGALAIRMVAFALFIPAILVPYWKLIGFIN